MLKGFSFRNVIENFNQRISYNSIFNSDQSYVPTSDYGSDDESESDLEREVGFKKVFLILHHVDYFYILEY